MCKRVYTLFVACGCILQTADALHSCEFGAAHPGCRSVTNKLLFAAVNDSDPYSGMCPYHKGQARQDRRRRRRADHGSDGSASSSATSTPPTDDTTQPGELERSDSGIGATEYDGMAISWQCTPVLVTSAGNKDERPVLCALPPQPEEQEMRARGSQQQQQHRHLNENVVPIPVVFGAASTYLANDDLGDQDSIIDLDQERGIPDGEGRLQRQPLRELSYTPVAEGGEREAARPADENRAGEERATPGAQINNENVEPQLGSALEPAQEEELAWAGWAPYAIFHEPIALQ
ncbi:uncharacterized protein E0L32_003263 [Thyridium curvatum]|uniref:Uncharacterized protein n=1 Tax=Thyridium curvatum TaxID=1093900 RepID=A0A507B209_9PEZI|nr:uncharacterized protein E0L32_003263 [Thyridium curvatum]TPX17145.1 hypothetical protein E0L32_003263 [Thyridium curvatum]